MLIQIYLIVTLYIIFGLFEMQYPAESGHTWKGRARNIGYMVILLGAGALLTGSVYLLASKVVPFQMRVLPERGVGISVLILLLYVFLVDFIFYWYHRAEHTFYHLWQIHELHHSDAELNTTSSMRTYWLEQPLQTLLINIPILYIIGVDRSAIVMLPIVLLVWLMFTHTNWKLRLGFLTPILCGPQVHRIHHSNLPQHQDKNFAQYFPFIDIIFGTYYKPSRDEFPTTGTPELATSASFGKVMVKPFKIWLRDLRDIFIKR